MVVRRVTVSKITFEMYKKNFTSFRHAARIDNFTLNFVKLAKLNSATSAINTSGVTGCGLGPQLETKILY